MARSLMRSSRHPQQDGSPYDGPGYGGPRHGAPRYDRPGRRPPRARLPFRPWLPLAAVGRGLRRQAAWAHAWWTHTPGERRTPALVCSCAAVLAVVAVLPYGIALVAGVWALSAGWAGRGPVRRPGPEAAPAAAAKLQSLYEALTPCFTDPRDPDPLYFHLGDWREVFLDHEFDEDDRLARLRLRYPAYFPDQQPAARTGIERLLAAKAGRGREYHVAWYEEGNEVLLTALPPLPTDVPVQRFVAAPGETVLGITDTTATRRTTPVTALDGSVRQVPPLIWRTGPRSTAAHLLALGHPGSGTTTLLRSLALQALPHGDLVVVDGGGAGEYAFLAGRPGVLALESGLSGALAALEWAAHETDRRLIAVNRARQNGRPAPADTRRPLWILVDRLCALSQIAAAEGRRDPQSLLHTPLRHGRAVGITVAVADGLDALGDLSPALTAHVHARVALGALTLRQAHDVLGAPPGTTTVADPPPGRGYARLGTGSPCRLQVPCTPDPHDEDTGEAARAAVLALLPPPPPAADPAAGRGRERVRR